MWGTPIASSKSTSKPICLTLLHGAVVKVYGISIIASPQQGSATLYVAVRSCSADLLLHIIAEPGPIAKLRSLPSILIGIIMGSTAMYTAVL